jgi:hypothetical protein
LGALKSLVKRSSFTSVASVLCHGDQGGVKGRPVTWLKDGVSSRGLEGRADTYAEYGISEDGERAFGLGMDGR